MSGKDPEDEVKFVQQIYAFVQDEKKFESSDESVFSSEDSDSDGNSDRSYPDGSEPEKRRRPDDGHDSNVGLVLVTKSAGPENCAGPENSPGRNIKLRRFVESTRLKVYSVKNPATSAEESKWPEPKLPESMLPVPNPAVPNALRRKPGPLRRLPKLMCKLNLDNIDVSAVKEKKNLGNATPVFGAGVPMTVNLSETDDENYLLDEEKILHMFQDGDIIDSSSEDYSRQSELTANRIYSSRTPSERKEIFSPIKKKTVGVQGTKNTSPKETDRACTGNVRNMSLFLSSGASVEVETPSLAGKIVNGHSKQQQSTPKVSEEKASNNVSNSQNSLSKLSPKKSVRDQREDSSTRPGDDSDFVSKKTDGFKLSKSPKKTPEKKTDVPKKPLNGPVNRKKLLKGPKSRQNIISPEKKLCTGVAKSDAVKMQKESLFNVEKYVEKSPKNVRRISLTQEAIFARSQMKSRGLCSSTAEKVPLKDAATAADTALNDKTATPVLKESFKKTNKKTQDCSLRSTNGKTPARPRLRNSETDENFLRPSTSQQDKNSQYSLIEESTTKTENNSERNCDDDSGNELFRRPVRPERNNIFSRNIRQTSRMLFPLSDFATRRNIPTSQEEDQKETKDQSERTLAKLGIPNCEEPVCINWNHSNIPSVVNLEGMSGKLDPLVLSEGFVSRTTRESPLPGRLSYFQIPSVNLPKDVLSEIDSALNAD